MVQFSPEETPVPGGNNTVERLAERQLVEACQNGDKAAFGKLVRQYQKRLFAYIIGLTGSFDTAEDIVQSAFVKAWESIATFRLEYAFYPWLSTIARNLAFNHIAREEKKESLDELEEAGFDPQSADLGPLEQMMTSEVQTRYYKAVMALPVKYRTVFVLRHFEEMGYVEIAHYLKIPPGTVDSRLHRARALLSKELKDLL